MKNYMLAGALVFSLSLMAQTKVNKIIAVNKGQTISMNFDYPELIKISTWDKSEISIQGEVTINNGENDDAFELLTSANGNTVVIENNIKDLKNLPQMITVIDGSKKIRFKSKEDYKKYKSENGASYDIVSWGVDMDIILEIKIPKSMTTSITSVYGMVEVKDFSAPLTVEAKYGGVDASLAIASVGELVVETNYGQIYSNLDLNFDNGGLREKDFYTYVTAKPGNGPRYGFESKYGNVYLRKPK